MNWELGSAFSAESLKRWNKRIWILRFDDLRAYLATKDHARVVTSVIKERPDAEAIEAFRSAKNEESRRHLVVAGRKIEIVFLHSKAWHIAKLRTESKGGNGGSLGGKITRVEPRR
jgi:hypothetical protein